MFQNRTVVLLCVVLAAPGVALAQTEWVDVPDADVIPPPTAGGWDGGERYPIQVLEVDGTYHLYFAGEPNGADFLEECQIGHATSTDGVTWELDPANPVVTRGDAGAWDAQSVLSPAVIHDGTGFRMWYHGDSEPGFHTPSAIGYATSPDGSVWTKHPGNPVMEVAPPGGFDDGGIYPNTVILREGRYQMWYWGWKWAPGYWDWRIGYAESTDGLSWTRHPDPVLDLSDDRSDWDSGLLWAPSVLFDGVRYQMWYSAVPFYGWDFGVGYAVSSDGISWSRYWDNPVRFERATTIAFCSPNVLPARDGDGYEMWYRNTETSALRHATSSCCETMFASIIPAAAFAAGAEGSFYETDLDLCNGGPGPVQYQLAWMPRGVNNTDAVRSGLFTLGADMSVRYENVLAEVFDLGPGAFGALSVESTSPDLRAMARIANIPPDAGSGSFGQALVGIDPGEFTGQNVRRSLLFGTEHAGMRYNVGCLNASRQAAVVRFELFDSAGTLLGTDMMVLQPWGNDQINRIFEPYRPVTGHVEYWSAGATGQVYCYGSVLDNVTSDPTTVPPM